MKVTRKYKDEFKSLGPSKGNDEISPSLMLRDLKEPIEGMEPGQDFEAHIKGHCRGHDCRDDGKHHYDLDVHDFEHKGGGSGKNGKPKKSTREEVADAMDRFDKEESEKKSKKEEPKKEEKKEEPKKEEKAKS